MIPSLLVDWYGYGHIWGRMVRLLEAFVDVPVSDDLLLRRWLLKTLVVRDGFIFLCTDVQC